MDLSRTKIIESISKNHTGLLGCVTGIWVELCEFSQDDLAVSAISKVVSVPPLWKPRFRSRSYGAAASAQRCEGLGASHESKGQGEAGQESHIVSKVVWPGRMFLRDIAWAWRSRSFIAFLKFNTLYQVVSCGYNISWWEHATTAPGGSLLGGASSAPGLGFSHCPMYSMAHGW